MLSMKTLRVAIVTMGSALLLGPGFAAATIQHLDGTSAAGNKAVPIDYAYELLTLESGQAIGTNIHIMSPVDHDEHRLVVTPDRRIEKVANRSSYLRLSFSDGMTFNAASSGLDDDWRVGAMLNMDHWETDAAGVVMCGYDNDTGTDGTDADGVLDNDFETDVTIPAMYTMAGIMVPMSHTAPATGSGTFVAFRIDLEEGSIDYNGNNSADAGEDEIPIYLPAFVADSGDGDAENTNASERCDISATAAKTRLWVNIKDNLAIPAGTGHYAAKISLHIDPDDAATGASPSTAVGGNAVIVSAVEALDVEVKASQRPAVAHVGTAPVPFLWFYPGDVNAVVLGTATADLKELAEGQIVYDKDGTVATGPKLIPDDSVTITIDGDLSIGAFNLGTTAANACVAPGSASAPAEGNVPSMSDADEGVEAGVTPSLDAGTYHLCVQVDLAGPGTNRDPIPAGHYMATITKGTEAQTTKDLLTGVIGRIVRNGTTVKVTYLTVADKYNQRLILVNDGANDAAYEVGSFLTEDGTNATALAMASGTIPAGGQLVIPVEDIVRFDSVDGRRHRAAATISINADVDDVQVATTQVNLEDGSTDTVVYAAVGGAVVQ